jgi:hypothetical protein
MNFLKALLKDKKGFITIQTAGMLFIMSFLFSFIYQYGFVSVIASGTRNTVRNAVIQAVNANAYNVFNGFTEENSGAYEEDNVWSPVTDSGDIGDNVASFLGLSYSNGGFTKADSDGTLEYSITDLQESISNPPLAANSSNLSISASYVLNIRVAFLLIPATVINIPQTVSAGYEAKF